MTSHIRSARLAFASRSQSNTTVLQTKDKNATMASTSVTTYDQLTRTAEAFIQSFNDASQNKDISKLSSTLTPDCIRHFAPDSLLALLPRLRSGLTISQYEENEAELFTRASVAESRIVDKTVDEKARKVVLQIRHHVELHEKVFDFEHIATLRMTDDGTMVKGVHHFVDALAAFKFMEGSEEGKQMKDKQNR